jgi:hypothetical protein
MNSLNNDKNRPGIRELLVFRQIMDTYTILSGSTLGRDDLTLIEKAVGLKHRHDNFNHSSDHQEKFSEKQLETALSFLGIRFGTKFLRKDITRNNRDRKKAVSLFIELKRLGFIKETKSGFHRVISREEARKRVKEIIRDPRGLNEIMGTARSGWDTDDLLMEADIHNNVKPYLKHISNRRILKVLSARVKKKDWRNVEAILEEMDSRLPNLTNSEFKEFTRELARIKQVKKGLVNKVMNEKSGYKWRFHGTEGMNDLAHNSGYTRGMGGAESFFLYVKKYMETGNAGYLDMALSYVSSSADYPLYRRIVDFLENRETLNTGELIGLIKRLKPDEAVVILSVLQRTKAYRWLLPALKNRILVETKAGKRDSKKIKYTVQRYGGRVDTRRSIFRLARNTHEFVVYRRKTRLPGVTLVVDVSGSLRGFSGDVLLYASTLSGMVEYLIVFSDRPFVYRCGKKCRIEEILSNIEFGGNTNIIEALKEAEKHTSSTGKIIVISDFRHNTSERQHLVKLAGDILLNKRRKITFIAIGNVDTRMASALEGLGARVVEPSDPRVLRRILFRELQSR